ncbi:hypothetical protein ACTMU2_20825 [Cupriavidus basilensis]
MSQYQVSLSKRPWAAFEAERLDVAAEDEQTCQLLTAGGHAELRRPA